MAAAYRGSAISSYSDVKDEIGKLDLEIQARRQAVDAFRAQYDIVSMEHKENDVLAQIAGLNQSYTEARNRLAKAQAHLQALRNSIDAGTLVVRPKDDPGPHRHRAARAGVAGAMAGAAAAFHPCLSGLRPRRQII